MTKLNEINIYIINNIGYKKIILIIALVLAFIAYKKIKFRNQYSDEAWKIVKKNGRKSIFWYDEYGNETYKKPKKSNPPDRHKRGL